jgi:hypothetical protein
VLLLRRFENPHCTWRGVGITARRRERALADNSPMFEWLNTISAWLQSWMSA